MSEMLGNRYFLARQFSKAIPYFEDILQRDPSADFVRKKLIICYIETGKISQAFSLFYELVRKDPHIIIDTDTYYDDCPCAELIPKWQKKENSASDSIELLEIMGMLNLYCDVDKSLEYFDKAAHVAQSPSKLYSVMQHIQQAR